MIDTHNSAINSLPVDSSILMLAASGNDWFAATTVGLFHSTNSGRSWVNALAASGITQELVVPAVALSPNYRDDHTMLAGAAGGILRSADSGVTWARANTPLPDPFVSSLAFSPSFAQDGFVFAGTVEDGVLQSKDIGINWASWNFHLIDLSILSLAISPDFDKDCTLYAGTPTGIFTSQNAGRTWQEIPLPCGCVAVISLVILGNGVILAGTEENGLFRSEDHGQSWLQVGGPEITGAALLIQGPGGRLAADTNTGLLFSADDGTTWQPASVDLPEDLEISTLAALENGWLVAFTDGALREI
jgi:photosystem II stability/assembly factor-like uncharacterized protein